jgi:toxin ParE1/3/4
MTGYVLSPRAQADIDEIWDYTADQWGDDQAERYIRDLRRAIETIARNPNRGRSCDFIRPGYRKFPVGAHMILFRLIADGINVVRILHQSMDFERHLS